MKNRFEHFNEFYPHYLAEHQNKNCRLLHVIGTTLFFYFLLVAMWSADFFWLIFCPLCGYGFAWAGHFYFEKNKPATFQYPLFSLMADFKLYFEILNGTRFIDASKDKAS